MATAFYCPMSATSTAGRTLGLFDGVDSAQFLAGFLGCEHPFDVGAVGIAPSFPGGDLGDQPLLVVDAPVQALTAQDADLDLHHVQPTGMFGGVVELHSLEHAAGFGCREGVVEGAGRMDR